MAKSIGKYFIAIVPQGEIQEKATDIKLQLKEKFNLKYALKSPAHITLKMPFNWNESKESKLVELIAGFCDKRLPFELRLSGFDRFGKRVIFIKVKETPILEELQLQLSKYCKTELKLVEELSDRAYHPHMTLAFKDLKEIRFGEYWDFIKQQKFEANINVSDLALLKRTDGRWQVIQRIPLTTIA